MLSQRLVQLVEANTEKLTARWVADVKTNPSTAGYHRFTEDELRVKISDVFKRLGHWLDTGERSREVAMFYTQLGRTRAAEGFKLAEIAYAVILAKRYLIQFIDEQGLYDSSLGINTLLEFHDRVNSFFDKVMFFMATGYENAHISDELFYKESSMFDKIVEGFSNWIVWRK